MSKILKTVCIMCPVGCNLEVTMAEGGEVSVTGNTCPRGVAYGRQELIAPKRIVTSLVKTANGKVISCKTAGSIDKKLIFKVLEEIKALTLDLPVEVGDVLIGNVCDTGVDVLATSREGL